VSLPIQKAPEDRQSKAVSISLTLEAPGLGLALGMVQEKKKVLNVQPNFVPSFFNAPGPHKRACNPYFTFNSRKPSRFYLGTSSEPYVCYGRRSFA
jgi:hypothetical protein